MGDRFDTDKTREDFFNLEKRIDRDVSDWVYRKVRHSTTEDSLKRYKKIKGKSAGRAKTKNRCKKF